LADAATAAGANTGSAVRVETTLDSDAVAATFLAPPQQLLVAATGATALGFTASVDALSEMS
jgi:hypothetical protein